MSIEVSLEINGKPCSVRASSAATLLDALRDQLQLTGTKRGCNYGVCGACTVLLDGKPARSCLSLIALCEGRTVSTVEGLGTRETPSRLQQAMVDSGAIQCGFCTPGILMSLTALLANHPQATANDIRHALSGHLCRCSGYAAIVEAAIAAAGRQDG